MTTKDISVNTNKNNNKKHHDIDAFIKLVIVIILATVPFYVNKPISLALVFIYLLIATAVTKIKFKTLMLSAASYFIIVLFPFMFGYFTTEVIYHFSGNEMFSYSQSGYEVFLRLFRLFVIWFVSILYFHTTKTETVIGLFDKLLSPLKLIGVPIQDYLNVIMCIIIDLKGKGSEIKDSFMANARAALGGGDNVEKLKLSEKIKGISKIIVSLLVNSFEKINEVQELVENLNTDDLYNYKFKIGFKEVFVFTIFIVLIIMLFIVENKII